MGKFDKKRLLKYLESAKRSGEHKYLTELFAELENNKEFDDFLRSDWNDYLNSKTRTDKDLSDVLRKLHAEIEKIGKEKRDIRLMRFFNTFSRIAAVLLLPLTIALLYFALNTTHIPDRGSKESLTEVYAPENSRVKYVLPDSSVVWLNSGSGIKFYSTFEKRNIQLIGKAYFDVTHQKDNPFSVVFNNGKVEVLGTKFSVSSKENGNFNVVLVEGRVRALVGKNNIPVILKPNQMLTVNGEKHFVKEVKAANIVAWKDGKLIFRDTPLRSVFERLSDWYDVDIRIEDEGLNNITYRGTFQDENLEEVLNLMSLTLPIKSKVLPRKVLPDGTFEKKKVIIYSLNNN